MIVERGETHPHLYSDTLEATDLSFIAGQLNRTLPFKCTAKIRYRQQDQACTITKIEGDLISVVFDHPQRAITPRQSVVFYDGDICLGGAMIRTSGPTYYNLKKELILSLNSTNILDH